MPQTRKYQISSERVRALWASQDSTFIIMFRHNITDNILSSKPYKSVTKLLQRLRPAIVFCLKIPMTGIQKNFVIFSAFPTALFVIQSKTNKTDNQPHKLQLNITIIQIVRLQCKTRTVVYVCRMAGGRDYYTNQTRNHDMMMPRLFVEIYALIHIKYLLFTFRAKYEMFCMTLCLNVLNFATVQYEEVITFTSN